MAKTIAAGIFVVNKNGQLLVCHPTNHKPDFWSIPKGKVEDGETYHQAAIRETYEESNLMLDENDILSLHDGCFSVHELSPVNYGHNKKMIYPFLYHERPESNIDWNKVDIKCNSNVSLERGGFPEMDAFKWVSINEATSILHETQVACLDKIKELIDHTVYKKHCQ
jgi:8-oxo-dGTP pyrophosphatase MutT (NUDIX family)